MTTSHTKKYELTHFARYSLVNDQEGSRASFYISLFSLSFGNRLWSYYLTYE